MSGGPRRYQIAAVLILVALPAAWHFFPRKPFDVGMQLARSGKRAEALAVWEKACDGGDIDSCARAAILRVSHGEVDAGRTLLKKAKAKDPKHVWVLLLEASFLELDGKPAEAKALYEEAERLHPASGLPATSLAKLALLSNDLAEAERCTERALAAEPTLGAAHAMKGRVLVATSSLKEALASFVDAIELDGMAEIDWVALADAVAMTGGAPEDRLSILEDAASRHPDSHLILVPLGIERAKAGDVDRGIEALRLACDIAPDVAEPRIVLGILFLDLGNPGFAVPRLEEALKIDPANVDAARLLATAWMNMGESGKALPAIAELLARDLPPDQRVRTLYLRARYHQNEGKEADAMEDVNRILALDPKMEEANWLCGHMALEAGRLDDARRCLDNAIVPGRTPDCAVFRDLARLAARQSPVPDAVGVLRGLVVMCGLDRDWIKANPEFRALERDEAFRLLMEGAEPAQAPPTDFVP